MRKPKRTFEPMSASNVLDIHDLAMPVYASPKIDGWRCVIGNGGVPLTRKLLPIPNLYIREQITAAKLPEGFDGELTLRDPVGPFQDVTSAVASVDGAPDFRYRVFDWDVRAQSEIWNEGPGYMARITRLAEWVQRRKADNAHPHWLHLLVPVRLATHEDVAEALQGYLDSGFEGAIVRSRDGLYKYGRSTLNEGHMLKLKPFLDAEAVIVGFEEEQRNKNKAEKDAFGRTKRSSAKAGKVGKGVLGKFICSFQGKQFKVGAGLTAEQRIDYWVRRGELLGKSVKFKHQKPSAADKIKSNKPRSPVFLGLRHEADLP